MMYGIQLNFSTRDYLLHQFSALILNIFFCKFYLMSIALYKDFFWSSICLHFILPIFVMSSCCKCLTFLCVWHFSSKGLNQSQLGFFRIHQSSAIFCNTSNIIQPIADFVSLIINFSALLDTNQNDVLCLYNVKLYPVLSCKVLIRHKTHNNSVRITYNQNHYFLTTSL